MRIVLCLSYRLLLSLFCQPQAVCPLSAQRSVFLFRLQSYETIFNFANICTFFCCRFAYIRNFSYFCTFLWCKLSKNLIYHEAFYYIFLFVAYAAGISVGRCYNLPGAARLVLRSVMVQPTAGHATGRVRSTPPVAWTHRDVCTRRAWVSRPAQQAQAVHPSSSLSRCDE